MGARHIQFAAAAQRSGDLQVGRPHLGRAVFHALAVAYDVDVLVPQPEAVAALLISGKESEREHRNLALDGAPAQDGAHQLLLGRGPVAIVVLPRKVDGHEIDIIAVVRVLSALPQPR